MIEEFDFLLGFLTEVAIKPGVACLCGGATSSDFSVGIVYWQNFSSVFLPPPVECQCQPPGNLL